MFARLLRGRGNAFHRQAELENAVGGIAGRILDRAADEPDACRQRNRFGAGQGIFTKSVLQIGGHGQIGRTDDVAGILQYDVPRESRRRIPSANGKGKAGARRRQRLEAERREDSRRTCIPGIGDYESALTIMQGAECPVLVLLIFHVLYSRRCRRDAIA